MLLALIMKLFSVLGWLLLLLPATAFLSTTSFVGKKQPNRSPLFMVASAESRAVSDMQRGMRGRIEDAFAAAKEKGEAAFVTFVTAGYPTAQGKNHVTDDIIDPKR